MIFNILLGLVSFGIALNGLLYQPKKDPAGPVTWRNMNKHGRVLLCLLVAFTLLTISKNIYDLKENEANRVASSKELDITKRELNGELQNTRNELNQAISKIGRLEGIREAITETITKDISDLENRLIRAVEYSQNVKNERMYKLLNEAQTDLSRTKAKLSEYTLQLSPSNAPIRTGPNTLPSTDPKRRLQVTEPMPPSGEKRKLNVTEPLPRSESSRKIQVTEPLGR